MNAAVQLASYKAPGELADKAIRRWTKRPYSHSELVVADWCYSASVRDKGVRRKQIELDPDKWDVLDLPWADPDNVLRHFALTDHQQYGWPSIIVNQVFNRGVEFPDAPFCNDWCGAALGIPNSWIYNPGTFHELCLDINRRFAMACPVTAR